MKIDDKLLKEWNYEKNNLSPNNFSAHSNKKVWWKCSVCNYEWVTSINSRTYGTQCPMCADKKRYETRNVKLVKKVGSLEDNCPEIAAEWDYELNLDLLPSQVTKSSNKKVWWKCKNNHKWEATIAGRVSQGTGCPYCSGRRVLSGFNDLKTKCPDIASEWHNIKNASLLPEHVTSSSKKKVWWKCSKCNYEWEAVIYSRKAGRGCPVCSKRKIVEGINDFAKSCPDLLLEWDYEKNTSIEPSRIAPNSGEKVWWKCKNGHSWKAKLSNRVSLNRGCPYCSGSLPIVGENDLATLAPQLVSEWNIEKNGKHLPSEYKYQSNKKVWWKCKNGHDFCASISSRTLHNSGCPYCGNKQVLVGFNDLMTTNPTLASEWDSEKNLDLTPKDITEGSDMNVWWKCSNGHSWQARVYSRGKDGTGCPVCFSTQQRSFPEAALYFYLSKYFNEVVANAKFNWLPKMEIDIFIPNINLGIEYDGSVWHKNKNKDIKKNKLCEENGIKLIRIREPQLPKLSNNDILLESYSRDCLKKGLLQLFELLGILVEVDFERDEDEIRLLITETIKRRSLNDNSPAWLKEWDVEKNGELRADQVTYASGRKIWWKCSKGHSWQAAVYVRQNGSGCPYCSNQKHGLILCIETGKTYKKYEDVSKDLEVSCSSVSLVLNGKQKSVKGYHLKFLEE